MHYLAKRGNRKIAFFTQIVYWCIARIQPVAAWFLQSFWLTSHAVVWLPKSCNQCVQLGAVRRHGSRERKKGSLQQLDYVARTMHPSSGFPLSQGNAEVLDRWGGKKHHLISCCLCNSSAKNYRNRIVYVKSKVGRFDAQCSLDRY